MTSHYHLYDDSAMVPVGDRLPADANVTDYLRLNLDDALADATMCNGTPRVVASGFQRVGNWTMLVHLIEIEDADEYGAHEVGLVCCRDEACVFA